MSDDVQEELATGESEEEEIVVTEPEFCAFKVASSPGETEREGKVSALFWLRILGGSRAP